MCELLGLSANRNVSVKYVFEAFKSNSKLYKHGWDFAWCDDKRWRVIKEPLTVLSSERSNSIKRSVRGRL